MTQEQIHQLFKQGYNQANWKQFLGETFSKARLLATPDTLSGIDSNVAGKALKLGYVSLDENGIERQIALYEVALAKGIILERNRVGLRNLLRKYWKNIDAAFIVYHNPDNNKWRFTYVSELTGYDADGEFIKIKTEPKRYTYVLGEGESTRTAAERFALIAKKGSKATLDDVKEAFSVEKLSKAFFDEYKKHYDLFCAFMMEQPGIRASIFNGNEKAIRDFNKKLLGRIVFLYFIQKKGWMGVPVGSKWGQGDFNFLTNLFGQHNNPDLFYSEMLTRLFFDTLNTKRKDDIIELVKGQPCRIPYLNGGLFEPENPKYHHIIISGKLFENLFAFFSQYNFTIYEDDPNDHTVAVDPEMLGHIFENLLEDNKDKGAFYTPKEIVHYMCQESLIEYLSTWFENKGYEVTGYIGFDKPDQPRLFSANEGKKGQMVLETAPQSKGKQIDRLLIEKLLKKKLDDHDKKLVKQHATEFHKALDHVKICDPAIGSGAFPMGLLQEIFTAKQTLWHFEYGNLKDFPASDVKLNIIQNSIYGVDIEKGAVDIARLRFWLSLVVDEEAPKALPNLDYKIVVGNSLVSKLGDDIIDIDWNLNETSHGLFGADLAKRKGELLKKISAEQKEFFNPDSDKKKLAADIRKLKIDLLINQLELMVTTKGIETRPNGTGKKLAEQTEQYLQTLGWKDSIKQLKKLKDQLDRPLNFFDWKLDFPEVLNELINPNAGFDIVIGNPPYKILTQNNSDTKDIKFYIDRYVSIKKASSKNIYTLFIEKGVKLLTVKGELSFIVPEGLYKTRSYVECVGFLNKNGFTKNIVTFTNYVFESAVTGNIIFRFAKNSTGETQLLHFDRNYDLQVVVISNQNIFSKIEKNTIPLKNIATTFKGMVIKDRDIVLSDKPKGKTNTFLLGKNISKWNITSKKFTNYKDLEIIGGTKKLEKHNTTPRILIRRTGDALCCAYLTEPALTESTLYSTWSTSNEIKTNSLLAILNSTLLNFYNKNKNITNQQGFPQILMTDLEELPIRIPSNKFNQIIGKLVDKIISQKSQGADTTALEQQIDNLVYRLYDLSYEEVKVIDPEFSLSKEAYEAIRPE